jgi:hypothetical protein
MFSELNRNLNMIWDFQKIKTPKRPKQRVVICFFLIAPFSRVHKRNNKKNINLVIQSFIHLCLCVLTYKREIIRTNSLFFF